MPKISVIEKYNQPEVVTCWQNLSRQGLQKCEQAMVDRFLPAGASVLDVGCGAGRAVLALSRAGHRMVGVDLSLSMLSAGRGLSASARFGAANLLSLPFADGSFDAVVMFFGALQHIPGRANRRQAIKEMGRVTRAGGRLLIGLDNLAPGLMCYAYWAGQKLRRPRRRPASRPAAEADVTLWSRETRQVHPLVWHARGVARTLRWRIRPALVDWLRRLLSLPAEPGDVLVEQFSLQATPGKTFYHLYRSKELVADAEHAGWRLLAYFCGTELNEETVYPLFVRRQDKQLFFAFERAACCNRAA